MKLHQLRYIYEIARQGLNVSQAAEILHTSQSGVSKACQLLKEELYLQIFQRHGKRLIGITEPGKIILNLAERVMCELENISRVGEEFTQKRRGRSLSQPPTPRHAIVYLTQLKFLCSIIQRLCSIFIKVTQLKLRSR